LVTVELAFDGQFELTSGDADQLIQLSGGDIMWQKERLLNIALGAVPDKVEDLAWIDCDLVFESPDWPEAARRALKSDNVIQLFPRCGIWTNRAPISWNLIQSRICYVQVQEVRAHLSIDERTANTRGAAVCCPKKFRESFD